VQLVDGSGLSRRDVVTADAVTSVLAHMVRRDDAASWLDAFPVGAVDGTLESRFTGTAAARNLRAKTGTMSNIRALAGYVRSRDGEWLAFTAIVNNFEGSGGQATAALDAVGVALAEFTRRP
jgi:D-alanyl-D-alanine carboxypeptidase/D-alanyl-D-alanine-endopeptidase (penicillin-binding protein 4)